jgi:hypothetical protein
MSDGGVLADQWRRGEALRMNWIGGHEEGRHPSQVEAGISNKVAMIACL